MKKVKIYTKYNRFWHWIQAFLIITLALTGFEIHGSYSLFGFYNAFVIHNTLSWVLLILFSYTIFWFFVTGQWRQFTPTKENLPQMIKYYTSGIFKGEPHPTKKSELSRLNPLQRITYSLLKFVLIPLQLIFGFAYYYYNNWADFGLGNFGLETIAVIHTFFAFLLIAFLIGHIYLTTTGETIFSNLKAMITGNEEIEE